jgi:5'-3' exonuclease
MKLGKHTLIIDGNYFVHSRLFVLPRPKNAPLLDDEDGKSQFMRKLCIDFASEVRKMSQFVDQIVIAVDSKSWRKDLFPDAEYKGTRVPDNSVNWGNVFSVYEEFQAILENKGVIIHKVAGAEADDILFGWSTQLNNEGKNCIVWTGDRDLIQLVDYNQATDGYTLWYYNSARKLITFEGFEDLLSHSVSSAMTNDELLFNMGSDNVMDDQLKEDFKAWILKNGVVLEEINCDDFIFSKILQGDKSDNIRSVVTWTKRTSTGSLRNYSITEKQATQILEKYSETEGEFHIDHFFNKNRINRLVDVIYEVVGKLEKEEIKVRFNQNLDLMLLHYNTIPESIQKGIYAAIEKDFKKDTSLIELSQMEKILEGTLWNVSKTVGVPKTYDAFASLDTSNTKYTAAKKHTVKLSEVNKVEIPATKKLNELF